MTAFKQGSLIGGGRYRLGEVVGAGGMAAVWRGYDERLGREVAVKVISDSLATEPTYLRRFKREAKLAAGLSHPHLVQVYDFGTEDDQPFLVMEYVPGGTLADRLDNGRRQAEIDVELLASELLDALGRIHQVGIVHRDIKPANILIGADGLARLTDFGIAHSADMTSLTRPGMVVGTARYLAPEVSQQQSASPASDLYSLGTVLRETSGRRRTSERLARLIDALCQADPRDRPASAEEAARLLAREPTRTQVAQPMIRPTRRGRILSRRHDIKRLSLATVQKVNGTMTVELDRRIAVLAAVLTVGLVAWAIATAIGEHARPAPRLQAPPGPAVASPSQHQPSKP